MLQQFLQEFGYFALFLGTFFEGETILVLAGFLAFRGYMDLKLVMIVAFLGSYAGDQLWYFLGRKHGRKLLARKPRCARSWKGYMGRRRKSRHRCPIRLGCGRLISTMRRFRCLSRRNDGLACVC